jgi:hypothetical protein
MFFLLINRDNYFHLFIDGQDLKKEQAQEKNKKRKEYI